MRVLYYIPGATFGGAHNQVVRLAEPLGERGFVPVVLLPDEGGDAYDRLLAAGVETFRAPLRRLLATARVTGHVATLRDYPGQVRFLEEFIKRESIDLVQLHSITSIDGAVAARRSGLPIVWQILDTRAPRAVRALMTPLVRRYADSVLVTGNTVGAYYPGLNRFGERMVPYFPPASGDEFKPSEPTERARVRAALGVTKDQVLVGDLGNFNPQKGHQYLLEAIHLLRHHNPEIVVRVRGGTMAGHERYERRLQRRVASLGLPPVTVQNLPANLTPSAFLGALDMFVMTSVPRSEGVPTVILEAMLAGLPVIASNVGGVAEAVREGDTGYCVEPGDVTAVAQRLEHLVENPDRRRSMGMRARATALSEFKMESCVDSYLLAYAEAIQNRQLHHTRLSSTR